MPDILILEDQPGWGALLLSAVRDNKLPACRLSRYETYREAIEAIHRTHFHVALLDYALAQVGPEGPKTGLDVARELRQTTPSTAIFLVTLVDPGRVESVCEELGVRLLEKGRPDLEAELVRQIRRALSASTDLTDNI